VKPLLLLVLLAILAIIAFGVGFTIHWLFVVAIILALLWLIACSWGASAAARVAAGGDALKSRNDRRGRTRPLLRLFG
jgi:hypothetical protein